MPTLETMYLKVNPKIAERLKTLAQTMDRSSSYLAAQALEEYLDNHEWHIQAIKEGIDAVDNDETIAYEKIKKMEKQT